MALVGVIATVYTAAQAQEAQRATQRQTNFTTASQQLGVADTFTQAAGVTTLATLVKSDPATYREPVCQIVQPYITQAAATDLANERSAARGESVRPFAYRPGVLLALQYISPNCPSWRGFQLASWYLPNTDLRGAHLSDSDMTSSKLPGTDLGNADLDNTDLAGTDLTNVDLSNADLSNADLAGADLTKAHLTKARLTNASVIHADLAGADFTGADLAGADFTGADLTGADLTGADLGQIKYDTNTKWPQGFVPPPSR